MSRPNRRAKRQARAVADEFHQDGRDRAGERVEDALLSDEMWCWLVEAVELAGDYGHERWKEIDEDDDEPSAIDEELRCVLSAAEVQLDEARDLREEELVASALEDVDEPDD